MKVSRKAAVAIGILGALGTIQGAAAAAQDDWSCVTEARAANIIRLWDEELGETKLSNVGGLQCDDADFQSFGTNDRTLRSDMWNQAADVLTEELMPTLALQKDANEDADVYYCDNGIKWYTLNSFKGCSLKDGKTFEYRGKTYKAQGDEGVMSVAMTLSYVCNQQARVRNVGISYTTTTKTACRP